MLAKSGLYHILKLTVASSDFFVWILRLQSGEALKDQVSCRLLTKSLLNSLQEYINYGEINVKCKYSDDI